MACLRSRSVVCPAFCYWWTAVVVVVITLLHLASVVVSDEQVPGSGYVEVRRTREDMPLLPPPHHTTPRLAFCLAFVLYCQSPVLARIFASLGRKQARSLGGPYQRIVESFFSPPFLPRDSEAAKAADIQEPPAWYGGGGVAGSAAMISLNLTLLGVTDGTRASDG
ncbi:hypothetical protein O3P69_013422 [Scylla paramamosain]|uniref:Uncharacterized protein n=1 Tax=Scylla paramamosain TaxID=85552 RepID=A0AAW0U064_SCYPA